MITTTAPQTSVLEEKRARYEQVVRNLEGPDIAIIESGNTLSAEQMACPKISAGREAWEDLQREESLAASSGSGSEN